MTISLLIVSEHAVAAEAVRRALRHTSNCRVIGFVHYERPAAIPRGADAPDVVLLDDTGRSETVLLRIPAIRAAAADSKLVLLTSRLEGEWLDTATTVGVDAVISRDVDPTILGTLVREIAAGTIFHPASHVRRARPVLAPPQTSLTAREQEILLLVASGASNARIATRLWVTEQTVKFHLSNVYRKLGVANRTQASHFAHISGLVAQTAHPAPVAMPDAA
jgi:DNA-binding NarL/FixJ family response regulator